MTRFIKVNEPYKSYDFGNGLPVILNTGTEVTDAQLDQIGALIAAMVPKVRPIIEEIGGVTEQPAETTYAMQQWVLDRISETVAAGARPAIEFRQSVPAAQWTIPHDRDTKPDVVLLTDDDGTERVFTDVDYPDNATVIVTWPAPTSGWAYIQ